MDVPFCFVKNKARLGKLVHKKNATVVALTEVRKEDESELNILAKNFREGYNDSSELRKTWGGGILGIKSQHREEAHRKALEREQLKKAKLA